MTPTKLSIPAGLGNRIIAGASFGHYIAHLLYYLNPQIDIATPRLLGITVIYALVGGLFFGSVLWGLRQARITWFGVDKEKVSGFGWVVVFCFFTTGAYVRHLFTLRIYLPRESVNMLSNATRVIAAATLLLFVLWLAERIRGLAGFVSIAGIGVIVLSSFFLFQRRDIYRADELDPVVVNVEAVTRDRPLVLVTIDSLPHDWLLTLEGEMNLAWLGDARSRGFFSRVEPFPTTNLRTIWASLATGKLPYRHGVTGYYSYSTPINRPGEPFYLLPRGVGFGHWALLPPVTKSSAHLPTGDALAIWDILGRLGLRALVVGFPEAAATDSEGAITIISEADLQDMATERAIEVDSEWARRDLRSAARAVEPSPGTDPELVSLTLGGLGDLYENLRLSGNSLPESSTPEGTAIRNYAAALDNILARVEARYPQSTLAVVSPSAFRPRFIPHNTTELLLSSLSRPVAGEIDGFILIVGRSIASGTTRNPVEVSDVVPTLLFSAGLPAGRDMDGRVVTEVFLESVVGSTPLTLIQTYEAERLLIHNTDGK